MTHTPLSDTANAHFDKLGFWLIPLNNLTVLFGSEKKTIPYYGLGMNYFFVTSEITW